MSEAPSLPALLNIEEQVENAFADYFEADHGLESYKPKGIGNLPDDLVWFVFELQQASGPEIPPSITHTGFREQNTFEGILRVQVDTERSRQRPSTTVGITGMHRERVAKARAAMLRGAVSQGSFTLSYLDIVQISFVGTIYEIDEDRGVDMTQLSYGVRIVVKDGAWPSS